MRANPMFITMARCWGVFIVTGGLIFQIACSPTPTTPPVTSQEEKKSTNFIEGTVPLITTTVETAMVPQEVEMPSRDNPKLDSSLNQLLEAHRRGGLAEAQAFARMHQINLDDELVQVEMMATEEAATLSLKEAVEAVGGEYQGHYKTLLQALVPISALESLADRSDVQAIRQPQRPVIR
jgi:hypothetical protein